MSAHCFPFYKVPHKPYFSISSLAFLNSFVNNMTQVAILQPSWLYKISPTIDQFKFPSYNTPDQIFHDNSFSIPYFSDVSIEEYMEFQVHVDAQEISLPVHEFSQDLEELDPILHDEMVDVSEFLESEEDFSSHWSSMDNPSSPIYSPPADMEINNQLSISHLFTAYGEAMEKKQMDLVDAIVKRITEKVVPVGETIERILYYLFQPLNKQSDYLKQESGKNFHMAFKAFYQTFPYGKFAHLAANSAIIEAMPYDAEIIHVYDFDMGDGVQWSSMIDSIGFLKKELRITSIRWSGDVDSYCYFPFQETKRRLYDHARAFGLKLTLNEMELHEFSEINGVKRRVDGREWVAFNCMVSLPHMGRVRNKKDVFKFLRVAKEILSCNGTSDKGVITLAVADTWEKSQRTENFGSYLARNVVHCQALLESIDCNFPIHLGEARTAMECLFFAPLVSSWVQKWEETKECHGLQSGLGLKGWKASKESIIEAKLLVREGESLFGVTIEGENMNEMVLEWRKTPLVRVSCFRS